jgi:hypothetical protein
MRKVLIESVGPANLQREMSAEQAYAKNYAADGS